MHFRAFVVLLPLLLNGQTVTTIAANGDIALANLQNRCDPNRFEQTSHIFADKLGLYLADTRNQRIRRFNPDGTATTIAGDGAAPAPSCASFNPVNDGANALAAHLYNPSDMVVRPNGNIVIADQQNNRIREINASGAIATIAGNNLHNVFVPGVPATASPLDWPTALALDAAGNVLFTEIHSNRIGRINAATGRLETVVDNRNPLVPLVSKPMGITVDRTNNILIADTGNHRIRRAAPDGSITTIAGTGAPSYCGDNGPAATACFDTPMDVKLDSHGNLYIADTGNSRVRRIDTAGIVTTVLGPDTLRLPSAIALDADDNLYITDWQNFRILKVVNAAISDGGIVDGAGFSLPPAPGGIFSIYGANLAGALDQAATTPLPTQLGGVTVTVNGAAVPLYFVSPGQINAQLPYDALPGPATLRIGAAAASVTIAAAAPAIFAALRQGTVAVAYVTGLGTVKPAVATGAAAPFDTLSYADAKVTATIDGIPADVAFAGLAPGFIGLGQVNIAIPAGATDLILVLEANGQKSKPVAIR
ncbi:MAG: SMP-30/gluconolactonase/LRE family protein [Candidatus Solibacter sp.]